LSQTQQISQGRRRRINATGESPTTSSQGRRRRINATGAYDSEESEGWQTQQISQGRKKVDQLLGVCYILMQLISIYSRTLSKKLILV
jgi:hypothetical protein